jgi:hypothetical protein
LLLKRLFHNLILAKYKALSKFSSYEEAAEWLDTHSTADLKTTPVHFGLSPNFRVDIIDSRGKIKKRGDSVRRRRKKKTEYIVFISHSSKDAWDSAGHRREDCCCRSNPVAG